jgi:hypothetical protein
MKPGEPAGNQPWRCARCTAWAFGVRHLHELLCHEYQRNTDLVAGARTYFESLKNWEEKRSKFDEDHN